MITWETQFSPFGDHWGYNDIFSIFFVNTQTGWITGDWGRITRYYGTTDVEDDVNSINQFALSQNYANPFNPSTVISYQLPVGGSAKIKVYNILGNEITTLVNEYKPAGMYEVEFDAEKLSSGVYFYQLQDGEYTAMKKMILIK